MNRHIQLGYVEKFDLQILAVQLKQAELKGDMGEFRSLLREPGEIVVVAMGYGEDFGTLSRYDYIEARPIRYREPAQHVDPGVFFIPSDVPHYRQIEHKKGGLRSQIRRQRK